MDTVLPYLESARAMYTTTPIGFAIISLLVGGIVCKQFKFGSVSFKIAVLGVLLGSMYTEISLSVKRRDNAFKLISFNTATSHYEFESKSKQFQAIYHPDNKQTGDSSLYERITNLREGLKVDYKKKVELYEWYGDLVDLTDPKEITETAEENLLYSRGLEFVATYIMLLLTALLFFQNSANRGIIQKCFISAVFLFFFLVDLVLGYKESIPAGTIPDQALEIGPGLKELLGAPHATVAELSCALRQLLILTLSIFYFGGILFQLKVEDNLCLRADKYYRTVHAVSSSMKKGDKPSSEKINELKRQLLGVEDMVVEFINQGESTEGFFKRVNMIQTFFFYGIIAGIVGIHLYSKYS